MTLLPLALFAGLMLVAAAYDLSSFTIPNWISAVLVLTFLPCALMAGLTWPQIGLGALIGAGLLAIGVGLFAFGWIGGGDAKLLAAAGLWMGWPGSVHFLLYTALAGGALAVMLLALRHAGVGLLLARGPGWVGKLLEPGSGAPYGVAIAAGALLTVPVTPWAASF
jgi:prepilin peptidase CpaA